MLKQQGTQQYDVRVSMTWKIVLAIIIPALMITPIMVALGLYFPQTPDWAVIAVIIACMAAAVLVVKFIVGKLSARALLTLQDDAFHVAFEEQNFYTPESFVVRKENIVNFSVNETNDKYYLSFTMKGKPANFNLEALSSNTEHTAAFAELTEVLSVLVGQHNEMDSEDTEPITSVSTYQRGWAKVLAILIVSVMLFIPFISVMDIGVKELPWWKQVTFYILALPFLVNFYVQNFKKKGK